MAGMNILWYVGTGFLLGWVISTLTEWLWFRRRHVGGAASVPPRSGAAQSSRQPAAYPAPEYQPYGAGAGASAAGTGQPSAASGNRPDPLSDIRGIGDVYEQRLYEAGIFTWHELGQVDVDTLRAITKALPTSQPESWIEQARQLAAENGRIGASYTGPVPDDLTRIPGIDQVFEQELVRAGIVTFAQLAQTTAPELAAIIPAHRLDDAIDFAAWIGEARELQAKG
jgi:predicted flap endonuclease-1-like 5' DNA nuclease